MAEHGDSFVIDIAVRPHAVFSRDGTRKAWLATDEQPNNAPVLHVADTNGNELMTIKFRGESEVPISSEDDYWMEFQDNGSVLVGHFPVDCDDAKAMELVAWNIDTGEALLPIPAESMPNRLRKYDWHFMQYVWPRQGSSYALKTSDPDTPRMEWPRLFEKLHVGDLKTGKIKQLSTDRKIRVVAFSNDGTLLAVSMASTLPSSDQDSNDSLAIYRASDLTQIESIPNTGTIAHLTFSEDDQQLAVATHHTIEVWERKTGVRRFDYLAGSRMTADPVFSPDGRRLLAFCGSRLEVLDAVNGQLMLEDDLGHKVYKGDFIDGGSRVKLETFDGYKIINATPVRDQVHSSKE